MRRPSKSIAVAIFLAVGVAHADDDADMAEAKKQFHAGVNLLDDPEGAKYEDAYHAFKKAYALSRNPKVLGNIGFCAMHLEKDGEAIEAYAAYLREAPGIEERERTQIQRDLATLTSTAAQVKVRIKHASTSFQLVDTRVQTRGPAVENSYVVEGREITLRVRPGRHVFKVKAGSVDATPLEAQIEPATSTEHEVTFPAPRALSTPVVVNESPSIAGPVILGITGALSLGAGATAGLLARGKQNDIAGSCPNDLCPASYDLDGERDKAKTLGTIADVAFVSGGVLVGGAILWYVLLPKRKTSPTGVTASAMCTGTGCGFTFGRGF